MRTKTWGPMLLLAASLMSVAQGRESPQPLHGGLVRMVGQKSFELVAKPNGAELYVLDAGQEVASASMSVTLIIEYDGVTSEVIMLSAGGNKFVTNEAKLSRGAKVVVLLLAQDRSKTTARFVIK